MVHRDVKPGNILLKPVAPGTPGAVRLEGLPEPVVPMLTDFGVALALVGVGVPLLGYLLMRTRGRCGQHSCSIWLFGIYAGRLTSK